MKARRREGQRRFGEGSIVICRVRADSFQYESCMLTAASVLRLRYKQCC